MSGNNVFQRFLHGVLFGYVQMFLDGLIRLVTMPLLLVWLGPQAMGFRAATLELVGYFQTINPGTAHTMQAMIERDVREQTSPEQLAETRRQLAIGVVLQTTLAVLIATAITTLAFNMDFITEGLDPADHQSAFWFMLAVGAVITVTLLGSHHAAILTGTQHHRELQFAMLTMKLVTAGFTLLLCAMGWRLWGLAAAAVIGAVVFYWTRRRFANATGLHIPRFPAHASRSDVALMLGTSGWMMLATLGDAMGTQSFRFLSAVLPGMGLETANQVALLFVLPTLASQLIAFAGDLVRSALRQRFHGDGFGPDNWPVVRLYLQTTAILATVIFICSATMNRSFVTLWVGEKYYADAQAHQTSMAICAVMAMWVWNNGLKNLLYVRDDMKLRGLWSFIEGLVVIGTAITFGSLYGPPAMFAAGAATLALLSTPVYSHLLCNRFQLGFPAPRLIFSCLWYPALAVMAFALLAPLLVIRLDSWWTLLGYATLVGTSTLVLAALWLWRPLAPLVRKTLGR